MSSPGHSSGRRSCHLRKSLRFVLQRRLRTSVVPGGHKIQMSARGPARVPMAMSLQEPHLTANQSRAKELSITGLVGIYPAFMTGTATSFAPHEELLMINARRSLRSLAAAGLLLGGSALLTPLHAQTGNNPFITLTESGAGTITFPGQASSSLPGVRAADPGPGGLGSALTFNLLGPPSLVAGDLFLYDGTFLSDVLRFNPAGTGSVGYAASVVFYSALDGVAGSLADTGFPSLFYTNTVSVNESATGATYTPTANQPGYVAGFAVTYSIASSPIATPEPASLVLLGTGLVGLFGVARRKRSA